MSDLQSSTTLLELSGVSVLFTTESGDIPVIEQVSFKLKKGETLGIVGESGCGKSMTALAILGLIASPPLKKVEGEILWKEENLIALSSKKLRKIRGKSISMIFQEPMSALNPVLPVGSQIDEVLREHTTMAKSNRHERILELLQQVGIPDPAHRFKAYPHELSGGMRQRVMIAMALACSPELLIADEPTTALDVTTQAQILELLKTLRTSYGMSMLFISHDLEVVGYLADHVVVMYAGEVVESLSVEQLFSDPAHPYTRALCESRIEFSKKEQVFASIPGNVPALNERPSGCRFHPRCASRKAICRTEHPPEVCLSEGHMVQCFLY